MLSVLMFVVMIVQEYDVSFCYCCCRRCCTVSALMNTCVDADL